MAAVSTSKIRYVRIECDQCGQAELFATKRRSIAEQAARRLAWEIGTGNQADLCPQCAKPDRT